MTVAPSTSIERGETSGYEHGAYAASLSELGKPRLLPRSEGWLLERVPRAGFLDAMGCYPIFGCRDWTGLKADLDDLRGQLVSVVAVTDPFGDYDEDLLKRSFGDAVRPYKDHFVVDLRHIDQDRLHPHHRRNLRQALANVQVDLCASTQPWADEWASLYEGLVSRHQISSIAAFSATTLKLQLDVPGAVLLRASTNGQTQGMAVWYRQRDVAYFHLGASSAEGYETGASYALFWRAIEYFREQGATWLDLGAGAGVEASATDGLTRFKRGWATGTRTAYLCGSVLDPAAYRTLAADAPTDYFPAYRAGEFS